MIYRYLSRAFAVGVILIGSCLLTRHPPDAWAVPETIAAKSAAFHTAAEPMEPQKAALTIPATVHWGSANRDLVILTKGAPPSRRVLAVDSSGSHAVRIRMLKDGPTCAAFPIVRTGLGTKRWCLQINGIAPGQLYQAVLHGASTDLTLTVVARHDWLLPSLTALAALVIAVLLLWLSTHVLPDRLTAHQLSNEKKDDDGIDGLNAWATAAEGRLAQANVVARLRWAKRYGKAQALGARAQLKSILADQTRLPECPLRQAAQDETDRGNNIRADELLTPAGERATSTAEHLLQLVEQASDALAAFDQVSEKLLAAIPENSRPTGEAIVRQAKDLAETLLSEFTMDDYLQGLRDYLRSLHSYIPDSAQPPPAGAVAALAIGTATPGAAFAGVSRAISVSVAAAETAVAVSAVMLVAVATMVIAVGAVLATQYLPKQTFGVWTDYLGLALAAFGSSSLVGLLALLLLLRGPQPWYA